MIYDKVLLIPSICSLHACGFIRIRRGRRYVSANLPAIASDSPLAGLADRLDAEVRRSPMDFQHLPMSTHVKDTCG
jgi:hypothetical protein